MSEAIINGQEPRRITVDFAEDGTPNIHMGDPVTATDVAVAAMRLSVLLHAPSTVLEVGEAAERELRIDFDAKGRSRVTATADVEPDDFARAHRWLHELAGIQIVQSIVGQQLQQRSSLVLPNRATRRAMGRA
jgi:hypothetical protein